MLGPSKKAAHMAIEAIEKLPAACSVTGHAPYSTTPELLHYIKERSDAGKSIFSLHVAENPDEALLLMHGKGCFVDFLQERDAFDGTFPLSKNKSVIECLHDKHLLDANTICVHCVHVDNSEIEILAQSKSHICLCPQSNKFLNVGEAPLYKFLEYSILPCLGTDSVASNPVPDMWQEMALLSHRNPGVDAAIILRMATLGGAIAMQRELDYGSLENGRSANFLVIRDKNLKYVQDERELLTALTFMGRPSSIERACV
jgi:cytosine/adenosine deaminase-related metal-dependent hydrolase